MSDRIDVVVPVRRGETCDAQWLAAVREAGGDLIGSLQKVEDAQLASAFLSPSGHDIVVLSSEVRAPEGWLAGLQQLAAANERLAFVSPLVLDIVVEQYELVHRALAELPSSGRLERPDLACVYFPRMVVDLLGPPTPDLPTWVSRAAKLGFIGQRALHVFVCGANPPIAKTLTDALAHRAVRVESSGMLRVGLDLRHVPPSRVGTTVYAVRLAEALANSPGVELTLVVRKPFRLPGMRARVVHEEHLLEGVDVLHKPSQVFDPADLELLSTSPAALVISHQDLIAHHVQDVFPTTSLAEDYRIRSYRVLHAAQRVIAFTQSTQHEIAAAYSLSIGDIDVVPHGVDVAHFASDEAEHARLRAARGLPERYFLAVGTDFPHKNLSFLVDAWRTAHADAKGDFPPLVLAGPASGAPTGFYQRLRERPIDGVVHWGEIDDDLLIALYQGALALVFASVYEGFGLPPLEAMAIGRPVIAFPISTTIEVCGEAALYPTGTSLSALASALKAVAGSSELRARLSAAGKARAAELTIAHMVEGTLAAYRRAIFRPSQGSLIAKEYLHISNAREDARLHQLSAQVEQINRSASFRLGLTLTAPFRRLFSNDPKSRKE